MLSPGNPRACHIHQHQRRMQCRTDRLLQHPSAKRGARRRTARVLGLRWALMRSTIRCGFPAATQLPTTP